MLFHQSAKEEVKQAADIVELIGQFVQLKKAGKNYLGPCPFHAETRPSFTVSPEKQMFHCFGCKKGGDVFAFWMEYHSASFPEALKELAQRYNVSIREDIPPSAQRKQKALKEALLDINEKAAGYFQQVLNHPVKGRPGKEYLFQRLPSEEIVAEFRLGYAADEWEGLTSYLRRQGVDMEKAAQAGLVIPKKRGGYYDRFRRRIVFPIFNLTNQVIGFGGRVLDESLPKYLNTPETALFHKGQHLYGLHAASKAIREQGRAVVVEGYMDLLALRVNGLKEVVATLGTALTTQHVRRLKGYATSVVMVFDPDEAGKAAMLKSMPVFLNENISAKALALPDGHDPDTFVNRAGIPRFMELVEQAATMFDFFLEQKLSSKKMEVEEKVRILKEILPVLTDLKGEAQRALYVRRLSEKIGIREEGIWSELKLMQKKQSGGPSDTLLRRSQATCKAEKKFGSDLHILNLIVHYPGTVPSLMEGDCQVLLSDPTISEIVKAFFEKYRDDQTFHPQDLFEILDTDAARENLREALLAPPFYLENEVEQAVREFGEKARQSKITASMQKARERGDIKEINELLKLKGKGSKSSYNI